MRKLMISAAIVIVIIFFLYYPANVHIDVINNIEKQDHRRYDFKIKIVPESSKVPFSQKQNGALDTFVIYKSAFLPSNFLNPLYGKTSLVWNLNNKNHVSHCGFSYRDRKDIIRIKIAVSSHQNNIIVKWSVRSNIMTVINGSDTIPQ